MLELHLDPISRINLNASRSLNANIMDFAADLETKIRGVYTAPRNFQSIWVYRPQDTYPMGYITYGNHMDKADGGWRYNVFSPNINNSKYRHGDRKYMASATNRARAVKNAAKYLRPLTVEQVVEQTQDKLASKVYDAQEQAVRDAYRAIAPTTDSLFAVKSYGNPKPNALQKELWHLLQSGYEFLDKGVEETLRAAFTALEDLEDSKALLKRTLIFVEVLQVHGQPMFRGLDSVPRSREAARSRGLGAQFVYRQHELPEHIAEKLAVLNMIDVGEHVPGVGYRAADNIFYAAKDQ